MNGILGKTNLLSKKLLFLLALLFRFLKNSRNYGDNWKGNFTMLEKKGLYDPSFEHDACGVGFVADIGGKRSHRIIEEGVQILCNLEHRGAVGGDMKTGDGAGMLLQIPHKFLQRVVDFNLPAEGEYGAGMILYMLLL